MTEASTRIVLIGTGRAAFHLGHALVRGGMAPIAVAGRDRERTAKLAADLGVAALSLNDELPACDLVLIAVKDDAIASVAAGIKPSSALLVHTSGAKGLDLLLPHEQRGVLWPILSLGEGAPLDLRGIPLVVEGNTEHARELLVAVAGIISGRLLELSHEQRQYVHLAAVLMNNFPVFLAGEAQRLLRAHALPDDLLAPLWRTMAWNVLEHGPEASLTGPARRGDERTMERHLDLLADEPELRQVYALISDQIRKAHSH